MKSIIYRNTVSLKMTAAVATTAIILILPATHGSAATVVKDAETEVTVEQSAVSFSGRLGLGYLNGQAREYVYWADQGGHTASELIWDIDSVYMFGLGASIRPLSWLNINADLWFNVIDGDGSMEDYDWQVVGMAWTDQSIHGNTDVTTAVIFDVNVEMTMLSTDTVSLNGIAGYRHDTFEWEARGGSYIYSIDGFRDSSGTFPQDELGITYEQSFDVPYVGIGFKGDFDRVHIAARVIGSIFVSGEATDQHHSRNLETFDDFSGESMLAFDISFGYDLSESLGITASFAYEKYDTMVGDSDWHFNDINEVYTLVDGAGADLETSMFSLNLTYLF